MCPPDPGNGDDEARQPPWAAEMNASHWLHTQSNIFCILFHAVPTGPWVTQGTSQRGSGVTQGLFPRGSGVTQGPFPRGPGVTQGPSQRGSGVTQGPFPRGPGVTQGTSQGARGSHRALPRRDPPRRGHTGPLCDPPRGRVTQPPCVTPGSVGLRGAAFLSQQTKTAIWWPLPLWLRVAHC